MSEDITKPALADQSAATLGEQIQTPDPAASSPVGQKEIGGPKGPEPTRFGDWERKGRCIDF
jgi:hypothetical protein